MPASGSSYRCAIASTAASAAFQPSASSASSAVGGREEQQRLAEGVELELAAHPVARRRRPARPGSPGRSSARWSGTGSPSTVYAGTRSRSVVEQPVADEPDRAVQQVAAARGRDGLPGEALVADPGVAVVVVAALLGALRAATWWPPRPSRRRGWSGRAAPPRSARRRGGRASRRHRARRLRQASSVRCHAPVRRRAGRRRSASVGDLEDQVVVLALGGTSSSRYAAPSRATSTCAVAGHAGSSAGAARPVRPGPDPVVAASQPHPLGAEPGPAVEEDRDPGRPPRRLDPAQQHQPVALAGEGEGLPGLDDVRADDPAAAPDQAARPRSCHPTRSARRSGPDDVRAAAAEQVAEDRVVVPARRAEEGDVAARSDQGAALAVGQKGVLAQGLRARGQPGLMPPQRPRYAARSGLRTARP